MVVCDRWLEGFEPPQEPPHHSPEQVAVESAKASAVGQDEKDNPKESAAVVPPKTETGQS